MYMVLFKTGEVSLRTKAYCIVLHQLVDECPFMQHKC